MTFVREASPASDKPKSEQPHFEIQVGDGRGLLLMRPRTFGGWLRVESLQLQIPEMIFPLDITGGMAQFQRQRCSLLDATFRLERASLGDLLARRRHLLEAAGFEDVAIVLRGQTIEVTARVRLREWTAELLVRLAVEGDERHVRVRVVDAATFGYIRRPAPLLAHDLLCVLTGASATAVTAATGAAGSANTADASAEPASARALGEVQLQALDWFALRVLAPAGWRLPELEGVRLAEVALSDGSAVLRWVRPAADPFATAAAIASADTGAATTAPALNARANVDSMAARAIDDALLRNDLAGAATACRLEITRRPKEAAALTARLLGILCTREASLKETEGVAVTALARWPDSVATHLALAAVRTARSEPVEAARHFADAARVAEARGDLAVAGRAATAAARQLAASDPARAVALYERVLSHSPADREATGALADLYAAGQRWSELRRLLQVSLSSARDDDERLEARLRAAELSLTRLRDPAAARIDLLAAAELAPEDRRVWELTVQACTAAGLRQDAVQALERLAQVLERVGDRLAQTRALLRLADLYEELGDSPAALQKYQQALVLVPDDSAALERYATVAARHGDAADAIAAYRRLLARSDGATDWRRRSEQQLLQLLVIVGDREAARRLLPTISDEPAPELLMSLARLDEAFDDLKAAADLWARAAAQLDGQHAAAAELELARICRAAQQPDEEQAALARAFALAPTGAEGLAAASGLIRLAREVNDLGAEGAWIDQSLSCRPPPAQQAELALRRAQLFLDGGDADGAARVLEALAATGQSGASLRRLAADVRGARGDAAGRAAALEELAAESDGVERARLLTEAVQSRLAAGDLERAAADARAAEALAPEELAVRSAVAEVAWRRRAWEEVEVSAGELARDTVGEARVEWTRRLASAEERMGRADQALLTLERAVAQADGAGEALARAWRDLGQLHERSGAHATAVDFYRRGGNDPRLSPAAARVELWRNAAEILHRRLGRSDEAAAALGEALALDGCDLVTLDALDALQSEVGDEAGLLPTLERKLALGDVPLDRRREWLSRYGTLAAAQDRAAAARNAFEELFLHDRGHLAALRWLATDAAARGDAQAGERYDAQLIVTREIPVEDQRAALARLATRARRQQRHADAETHLWAAVELSAGAEQLPLLVELEEVYAEGQRWADLVVVLNHHIATVADDESRLALELRRVSILANELATPNLAVEAAQAAVERYGAKPPLVAALADSLARVAVAASDEDEAVTHFCAAAAARRQLDDFAGAADALMAALERKPFEESLVVELSTLLGDLGDTARLRQALELHLGTQEGTARLPLLHRLVRSSEELGDEAATQRWLAEARQLEPEAAARVNVRTLVGTVAPDHAPGDQATLRADIAAAEAQLAATSAEDVTALRALHERLGQLYRDAGRLGDAFRELSTVLADEPSNVAILRALIDVAEADGRWRDAAQLLDRSSQLLVEEGERAALLYRAGELYLVRLGDRDSASDCYLKAVDLDPTHAPTLRRLVDYFWVQGDLESVAEMARALDDSGAFAALETSAGTRARAALSAAFEGDLKCAVRLGAALDDGNGVTALARAAVERLRGDDESRVAQAVRAVCGTARRRVDALRARLADRGASDAGVAALASRLGEPPTA